MKVPIGCDHAGYDLKEKVKSWLENKGYEVDDKGAYSSDSVDYPDFGHAVAKTVVEDGIKGVVICGSGNGINMTVNKYAEIRSALCWTREIAELARQHNNANVVAIPARFISEEVALDIIDAFFSTDFEGGRHERRVNKIACS
ncbi:MAG: ribose 5-phosphate isomerase B [Crocinitomicaceae bacterium]|nr:ribose 5-phosphate isomerase B [Crocinitomicaceae bacterium]